MTNPDPRTHLHAAVTLLHAADHEKDMLAWHARKDDFLAGLAAVMGVAGTAEVLEMLKPNDKQENAHV